MADTPFIARGFHSKRAQAHPNRLPPGQYETRDFPVLSAGPTPRTQLDQWSFAIPGAIAQPRTWTWDEFAALLEGTQPAGKFVVAFCDGGYTTNLPIADVTGGKAWVAYRYDDAPLEPE